MRILSKGSSAAYFTLPEMVPLVALESAIISTKHGCAAESAFGYAGYGLILSAYLGNIETGYRFGKLALGLLERFGTKARQARTLVVVYSLVQHWKEHAEQSIKPLLRAYQLALEAGDLEYAAISAYFHCFFSYYTGKELTELEKDMRIFEGTIAQLKQESTLRRQRIYTQVVLNLMGRAKDPCTLTGEMHDEEKMLPLYFETNDKSSIFHLHFNKLVLEFLFGRYRQALENSSVLEKNLNAVRGQLSALVFYFYDSLARLALYANVKAVEQKSILKKVEANQKKMKKWAKHAPMNHLHKYHLVEAQRCRVLGRDLEAIEHYKKAINLARENRYLNEEALANELAARYFAQKGLEAAARAYFQEAHYAYLRWGAKAKVEALEQEYSWLKKVTEAGRLETTATTTTGTRRGEMLDLSAVMKASQTISGEIRLEKLLKHLMKIVIENAGAQMGYLILEKEGKWAVEAEGAVDKEEVVVRQSVELTEELLPLTIINYVTRSKESVVLDEATGENQFSQDPYIKARQSRSILCAPLLHQNELKGIIYLENNLAAGAFTPDRVQMIQMLSSQAALSIENAKAFEEIDELNKNLMQKVEERTKELKMKADQLGISNEELVKASRAKSDFISSMSHELRSPMTAVIGYADLVRGGMMGDITDKTKDAMEKIKKSSNHLLSLIGDIMDMSKMEAGKMEIVPHDFLVEDTIKTVLASMKPLADEKRLYLKYQIEEGSGMAYGDLKRVTQILYNIIGNAIKFTEKGGIDVKVWKAEKECVFSIRDSGIGIPQDKREKVFAMFEQVDVKHKGTGLGMSITKQLVELHGGRIWFESEVGKGSTFYFTLPCKESLGK
jgi:signal transduction histidine kinase